MENRLEDVRIPQLLALIIQVQLNNAPYLPNLDNNVPKPQDFANLLSHQKHPKHHKRHVVTILFLNLYLLPLKHKYSVNSL